MSNTTASKKHKSGDSFEFGVVLVGIGTVFLLAKFDILDVPQHWWTIAAIFCATLGTIALLRAKNMADAIGAIFQVLLGAWFYISFEHLWGFNFQNSWPFLLIGAGLSNILVYFLSKKE
jgi:hypothetical protein